MDAEIVSTTEQATALSHHQIAALGLPCPKDHVHNQSSLPSCSMSLLFSPCHYSKVSENSKLTIVSLLCKGFIEIPFPPWPSLRLSTLLRAQPEGCKKAEEERCPALLAALANVKVAATFAQGSCPNL